MRQPRPGERSSAHPLPGGGVGPTTEVEVKDCGICCLLSPSSREMLSAFTFGSLSQGRDRTHRLSGRLSSPAASPPLRAVGAHGRTHRHSDAQPRMRTSAHTNTCTHIHANTSCPCLCHVGHCAHKHTGYCSTCSVGTGTSREPLDAPGKAHSVLWLVGDTQQERSLVPSLSLWGTDPYKALP